MPKHNMQKNNNTHFVMTQEKIETVQGKTQPQTHMHSKCKQQTETSSIYEKTHY